MSTAPVAPPATEFTPAAPGPGETTVEVSLREVIMLTASALQAAHLGERGDVAQSRARARLSELRRAAGFTPEQRPLIFQTVLDSLETPLAARDHGHGDTPSRSERAAFDALTLFALHMQSATRPMHVRGRSFGTAMRMLRQGDASGSLKPRFDAMLAARDERSRLAHARSLITLLRRAGIGLDYGQLAQDLRTLAGPRRAGVLLRWGRDVSATSASAATDASPGGTGEDLSPPSASAS